ncbi:MAG: alpha/beta fold hydrolase [Bacteroidales bacterium]|nr:alpha/beta fold hydrolase [Bacteroidales bacterium]
MKTLKLKASADDLELAVAVAEPKGPAKGIFQIVHGMAEHKERYYAFMNIMTSEGYVAVIHDHRGHGESLKSPDDLGYMYKGGWLAMVEDVKIVQEWAREQYPDLPVTLFGHSMGSMVVRSFAKRYDSLISRLIVCGCPSDNPAKGAGRALTWLIGTLRGWRHRPDLINNMSFGAYNKGFESEGPCAWLSRNHDNVSAYLKDPLSGYCFTANGFYGLLGVMKDCYNLKGWALKNPGLKILFISGANDPCRINDKAFARAVEFMRERGYKNVESKLYPGLRHEILQEKEAPEVFADILKFIG